MMDRYIGDPPPPPLSYPTGEYIDLAGRPGILPGYYLPHFQAMLDAWRNNMMRQMRGGSAPYRQGAALERLVIERLELLGWLAVRTAGSHGPADVWAARRKSSRATSLLLIQVKAGLKGALSARDKQALINTAQGVSATPVLATSRPGEGLRFQDLDTEAWLFE